MAHRPIFEVAEDRRFLLEKLGEAVRDGRVAVHSYCLMTNHVHILLCSLDGGISATMRDVLSQFTRWFNMRRERDGPLMKSRFFSRLVHGPQDRFIVTRYIDQNPVNASMVDSVVDYPHGSAWHFSRGTGPDWLERADVAQAVCSVVGSATFRSSDYARVFDRRGAASCDWLVEHRLRPGSDQTDTLEQLLSADRPFVRGWLQDAARMADGAPIASLLAHPEAILKRIRDLRNRSALWRYQRSGTNRCPWTALSVGLLRSVSLQRVVACKSFLGISDGRVRRYFEDHLRLMLTDTLYSERAAQILHAELQSLAVPRLA